MLTIQEYREQHPQYNHISDEGLSRYLYRHHATDIGTSYEEFDQGFRGSKFSHDPRKMGLTEKVGRALPGQAYGAIHHMAQAYANKPIGAALSGVDWLTEKAGLETDAYGWWAERMIDPVQKDLQFRQEWMEAAEEGEGFLGKQGVRFAGAVGHLIPTVAADVFTGKALWGPAVQAAKTVAPKAAGYMGQVAEFAAGMGVRGLIEGSQEGAEEAGYLGALRGGAKGLATKTAEGLLMHKVGQLGAPTVGKDVATGLEQVTKEGARLPGRLGQQVAGQAGVAGTLGTAELVGEQGRLPTLQEYIDMGFQGAAMGAMFATYPGAFGIASKAGKRIVRGMGQKDALLTANALERWGRGEIPEDIKVEKDGLSIKFKDGAHTRVKFVDSPDIEISDYIPDNAKVTTVHLGKPLQDVVGGKFPEMEDPFEMPGRRLREPTDPTPLGKRPWAAPDEMDPVGTVGKPTLQAPKPQKLKTEIDAGRTLPTIEDFKKEVAKRYVKKSEQLPLFQETEGTVRRTQSKKEHIKFVVGAAMRNGDILAGDNVRTTTAKELYHILKTGRLKMGTSFEGGAGISAHEMLSAENAKNMAVYGPYSDALADHPIAIVAPKEAAVGKGVQPNERLLHPNTDLSTLKFIIAGEPKLLKFNEVEGALRKLVEEKRQGEQRFLQEEGKIPDEDINTVLDMILPEARPEDYPEIAGRREFYDIVMQTYGLTHPKTKGLLSMTDVFGRVWLDQQKTAGIEGKGLEDFYQTIGAGGMIIEGLTDVKGIPRGAVNIMKDGRAVFYALNRPDFSTALHEIGHVAKRHVANSADMAVLENFYGVQGSNWKVGTSEEDYARDFERYATTGEVTNPELKPIFGKIKRWMVQVYKHAKGMTDVPVNKEVSKVFDRWLGSELETTAHADRVLELHQKHRGSTYNVANAKNMGGEKKIAVGVFPGHTEYVEGEPTRDQITTFMEKHSETLADERFNVGTWFNKETGQTEIDISIAVPEEWKAIALAKEYDQKSTFNLGTEEVMPTGGTGEGGATTYTQVLSRLNELDSDRPLTLIRFMRDGALEEVDPSNPSHRTGIKGEEAARVVDNPDAPDRVHYYVEGGPTEPDVARLPYKYRVEIPDSKIYDWAKDPDGYRKKATRSTGPTQGLAPLYDTSIAEGLMKKDGYWGYYTPKGRFPSTVVVFEQLPVREMTSHSAANTLEALGVPKDLEGVSLRNLTPEAWNLVGQVMNIEKNLGPVSAVIEVPDPGTGKSFHIPGGISNEFTWLDLFWLKAQGYNPTEMSPELHAAIQKKFSRTMEAGSRDPMQVFNNILFSQLSPNAGLTTNQLAYSRLRAPAMEGVEELAAWTDKLPDFATKADRQALSEEMRKYYGLRKVKADESVIDLFPAEGEFGIGYSGTQDLTYVAEFARLFSKNPEWFIKNENEGWYEYTERVSSQVPGIGTKVAAFGAVWQDPVRAAIGAIDRHMVRKLEEVIFATKKERREWSAKMVKRYNSKTGKKDSQGELWPKSKARGLADVRKTARGRKLLSNELLKLTEATTAKLRKTNGEFNDNVPHHLKTIDWIEEPTEVKVTNPRYRLAMEEVQRRGMGHDLGAFSSQHMQWDRIRNRLEPHEALFPGLYKLPKMSLADTRAAREGHAAAGYFPEGDRPVTGAEDYRSLIYYQEGELEAHLKSRLAELGQVEFNHRYNEGHVGAKMMGEYAKEKGISMKESKMFLGGKLRAYKVAYDKVAGEVETVRQQDLARKQKAVPQEAQVHAARLLGAQVNSKEFAELLKESSITELERLLAHDITKSRRVKAEAELGTRDVYEAMERESFDEEKFYANRLFFQEAPPPEVNKSFLDKYQDFIDTQLGDKLLHDKLIPLLEKVPHKVGEGLVKAIDREYRGSLKDADQYVEGLDEMRHYQSMGVEYGVSLGNRLGVFKENEQLQISDALRGVQKIENLPENVRGVAEEAQQMLINLGKQAVDLGMLSEEIFFKNYGKYFPRMYTSKEYETLVGRFGVARPNQMDMSRFRKRKDIPKEIREEMGEILTPGYPVAKAIAQITHDVEMARFFKGVAQNREWAIPQEFRFVKGKKGWKKLKVELPPEVMTEITEKGFKQLPDTKKFGALRNSWVHEEIYKDFMDLVKIDSAPERVWKRSLGAWKFGKVILSPKTHMRNVFSNSILAHLGGMPLYEQPVYLTKAWKEMKNPGEVWKQAKLHGILDATWTKGELGILFDTVNFAMKTPKESALGNFEVAGKVISKIKKTNQSAARAYEFEEQWFKVAKMMHNMERRGMDAKTAAKDAEKWLFNYSKLTRFQEKYRTSPLGAPFATFTFKALPRVAEAAIKTPWRFALPMAMMKGVESMSTMLIGDEPEELAAKKKMLPEWMQGGLPLVPNFVRFPITDKHDREYWLNLTYMMPWGDIGEGGGAFGIPGSLMPLTQPFVKEAWQQTANYDTFWKSPIVPEHKTAGLGPVEALKAGAGERLTHAARHVAPTGALDILKMKDAAQTRPDYKGRERATASVGLDIFAGVKTYPVDYLEQMERKIFELDPEKGMRAREINSKLKSFYRKRAALEDMGKKTDYYDKKIDALHKQIQGLGEQLTEVSETFSQTGM